MKLYECSACGHAVYFQNNCCVRCSSELAFDPKSMSIHAPDTPLCVNGIKFNACNWLASADSPDGFCVACDLNRTIPNLSDPNNLALWKKIQLEKNHLVYSLLRFGLPVFSQDTHPQTGLAFDFLDAEAQEQGPVVRTGHANGVITINIREADDAYRAAAKQTMGEPYRTLLGHFRHESAHYYWDRLVRDTSWLPRVRSLFGDDTADYSQALDTHYKSGPPANWKSSYISAYASAHAWEDWAETWAHYFHLVDALECAGELGLTLDPITGRNMSVPETPTLDPYQCDDMTLLMERWLPISVALNMLNRSLGQADAYPFVLSPAIVNKLSLIHSIIADASQPPTTV
ncbi:MAG: putative zinc-binding metallopeptidase [Granulosicoccus sp.]